RHLYRALNVPVADLLRLLSISRTDHGPARRRSSVVNFSVGYRGGNCPAGAGFDLGRIQIEAGKTDYGWRNVRCMLCSFVIAAIGNSPHSSNSAAASYATVTDNRQLIIRFWVCRRVSCYSSRSGGLVVAFSLRACA